MGRVWVVGSINADRPWHVARHPVVGETVRGEVRPSVPGGKGLNLAVAAARQGAAVALVGAVGDDPDGRWLVGIAEAEGIDVGRVRVDRDRPTGSALIVVADDGDNVVVVDPGANGALASADGALDDLPIAAGDVVVAQLEVPAAAVAAAFARARAAGATTVLNPSPVGPGIELAAEADVVVVNEHEAAALPPDVAGTVVTTRGAAGAVAEGPHGRHQVAGVPVEAVDTTGAGDCFGGVLAATLASGATLAAALDRANRAAALAVTRRGAVDAMPTAAEVDAAG